MNGKVWISRLMKSTVILAAGCRESGTTGSLIKNEWKMRHFCSIRRVTCRQSKGHRNLLFRATEVPVILRFQVHLVEKCFQCKMVI